MKIGTKVKIDWNRFKGTPPRTPMLKALAEFLRSQNSFTIGDHTESDSKHVRASMTYPYKVYIKFDNPFEFFDGKKNWHQVGCCVNGRDLI